MIFVKSRDILYEVLSNRGIGMAYENVQKLEKTVENNRKSVKNMKQQGRKNFGSFDSFSNKFENSGMAMQLPASA